MSDQEATLDVGLVQSQVTFRLVKLARRIDRNFAQAAKRMGLGLPEIRLLFLVQKHPGKTLSEAIRETIADQGNSSRVALRLEEQGYLTREPDEDDARKYLLYITDKGAEVVKAAIKQRAEFNQALTESLQAEDQEQLKTYLDRMLQRIDEI